MNKVILSILGHDRPGIIAAVSKILFEQNCNIENVSQTILQFEFAGIFIVSMPGSPIALAIWLPSVIKSAKNMVFLWLTKESRSAP